MCHLTSDTLPVGALHPRHYLDELKDFSDEVVGQVEEHEQGVGAKESETMSLKPWVTLALSADAVRPVVLALDPFKVASTTECKEEAVNSSSHGVQLVIELLLRPRMRDIRAAMLSTNHMPCIPLVEEALYASPIYPTVQFLPRDVTRRQRSQDECGQHRHDVGLGGQ